MKKESTKVALLRLIISKYPKPLTPIEVAQPNGYGIRGSARLNELSKEYGFKYEFKDKKYHFKHTWKATFKDILRTELTKHVK